MTYLIIGASSGLGRALADKFAKEKKNLIIVSRDDRDLIAIKSDLEIKYNIKVEKIALDFSSFEDIIGFFVRSLSFATVLHVHTGNSGGHMHPALRSLNTFLTILSSRE